MYCHASLFVSICGGISPRSEDTDLQHASTARQFLSSGPFDRPRERIPPLVRRVPSPPAPSDRTRPRPPDSLLPCRSPPVLPSWTGQAFYNIVLGPPPDTEGRVPRGSKGAARGVPGAPRRAAARRAPTPPSRSQPRPTRRVHGWDGPALRQCRGRLRPSAAAACDRRRPAARPPELRFLLLPPDPSRLNLPVRLECVGVPMPCSYELCATHNTYIQRCLAESALLHKIDERDVLCAWSMILP